MKKFYKGYGIDCNREESLGCGDLLYYSVFRIADKLEVVSDFTYGEDTEADYIGFMKKRIDEFIETKGASEEMEDYYEQ